MCVCERAYAFLNIVHVTAKERVIKNLLWSILQGRNRSGCVEKHKRVLDILFEMLLCAQKRLIERSIRRA